MILFFFVPEIGIEQLIGLNIPKRAAHRLLLMNLRRPTQAFYWLCKLALKSAVNVEISNVDAKYG